MKGSSCTKICPGCRIPFLPGPPKWPKYWTLYCLYCLFWDIGPLFWALLEVQVYIHCCFSSCFLGPKVSVTPHSSPTFSRLRVSSPMPCSRRAAVLCSVSELSRAEAGEECITSGRARKAILDLSSKTVG